MTTAMRVAPDLLSPPAALRALALVPALLFALYVVSAIREGRVADALWICQVANLILAVGLFFLSPAWIAVAVSWLILGLPLWFADSWRTGLFPLASVAIHVGGLAVGLFALARLGLDGNSWLRGFLLFAVLQQVCRWFTAPQRNINVAHRIYDGWEGWLTEYKVYWLAAALGVALCLWGIGQCLLFLFADDAPAIE